MAPVLTFTIVRESPIAHAARLAMQQRGTQPRKVEPVNQKATKDRQPRRMLGMDEVIRISDWLRAPGRLAGVATYAQAADHVNTAGLGLRAPITAANAEGVMKSAGLELDRPKDVNWEEAYKRLARLTLVLCDHVTLSPDDRAEIDQLASDLREVLP